MPLNAQQRNALEDAAILALGGDLRRDLVHGIRVMAKSGPQLAAVYWSDLHPGNEVEIAICDSRVSEKYDIGLVQRWVKIQKMQWASVCNTHQGGSNWPIFGLSYLHALEFLKALRRLRKGLLTQVEQDALRSLQQNLSAVDVLDAQARADLASLLPNRRNAVYDLVSKAGVSVSPWSWTTGGNPVASPRSNPAYCYNWSFGGGSEPSVACLWHESFSIEAGRIVCRGNLRQLAADLDDVASRSGENADVKNRARNQAARARAVDDLLRSAAAGKSVLRVIVNEGRMRSEKNLGYDRSAVKVRILDAASWNVQEYDPHSGMFLLVRGMLPAASLHAPMNASDQAQESPPKEYQDQFDIGHDHPETQLATGVVYHRDPLVRSKVLERAEGLCEFCNAPGLGRPRRLTPPVSPSYPLRPMTTLPSPTRGGQGRRRQFNALLRRGSRTLVAGSERECFDVTSSAAHESSLNSRLSLTFKKSGANAWPKRR
jgi:5-methylcytosine-specific restriction protein A